MRNYGSIRIVNPLSARPHLTWEIDSDTRDDEDIDVGLGGHHPEGSLLQPPASRRKRQ